MPLRFPRFDSGIGPFGPVNIFSASSSTYDIMGKTTMIYDGRRALRTRFDGKILFGICILSAVGVLSTAPGWCGAEVVVIPIQHRNAAELVPIVEHLLSSEGRVSHDRRTNSLIIIDRAEHLRNIRLVLDRTDAPSKQMKVRVRSALRVEPAE